MPTDVIIETVAEPCAVRTMAVTKNAIGKTSNPVMLNSAAKPPIRAAMLVCCSTVPNDAPAAVIKITTPPLANAACTESASACLSPRFCNANRPSATAAEIISAMFLSPTKLRKPAKPDGGSATIFCRMVFPAINTIGSSAGNNDRPSDGGVLSSRLAISSSLAKGESTESRNGTCHLLSPLIHFA